MSNKGPPFYIDATAKVGEARPFRCPTCRDGKEIESLRERLAIAEGRANDNPHSWPKLIAQRDDLRDRLRQAEAKLESVEMSLDQWQGLCEHQTEMRRKAAQKRDEARAHLRKYREIDAKAEPVARELIAKIENQLKLAEAVVEAAAADLKHTRDSHQGVFGGTDAEWLEECCPTERALIEALGAYRAATREEKT